MTTIEMILKSSGWFLDGTGGGNCAYFRTVGPYVVMLTDGDGCGVDFNNAEDCMLGFYHAEDWSRPIMVDVFDEVMDAINAGNAATAETIAELAKGEK